MLGFASASAKPGTVAIRSVASAAEVKVLFPLMRISRLMECRLGTRDRLRAVQRPFRLSGANTRAQSLFMRIRRARKAHPNASVAIPRRCAPLRSQQRAVARTPTPGVHGHPSEGRRRFLSAQSLRLRTWYGEEGRAAGKGTPRGRGAKPRPGKTAAVGASAREERPTRQSRRRPLDASAPSPSRPRAYAADCAGAPRPCVG